MSSIEEKKFLCLVKLSYDISLNVTRAYTHKNVLIKYDKQVSTFLKVNKHDIFHLWKDTPCCQCISGEGINLNATLTLTFRQIEQLFEFQGNGTPGHFKKDRKNNNVIQHCLCRMSERSVSLDDFDINLLETLLKRVENLESDDKMWLSTIRETRNHIAHATSTTTFDPGRLDKWWMMLEGSILGLVKKIPDVFYVKSIESQIDVLKNSNLEAMYGKKIMEEVNAENKILLEDLAERNDTRIVESENNIKQAMIENINEFKRHLAEVKGEFMRKLEELEAIVKGSVKQDSSTYFRIEHDSPRKIHVECQVEADDIDEHLTIKNLLDPSIVATDESGDGGFKVVNVKQKCILLELTASPEILSSEERLLNAIDQLINQVVLAGNLDTRVPGKMTLNLTFTSPLSREEQDVFSRVFCTSDKAENIYSDVLNQIHDYSIGTVTRETQTEEIFIDSNHSTWNMKHQMQQEIQDLHKTVDELRKDNEMMSAMVDQNNYDNLSLKTELENLNKERDRKHEEMQQKIDFLHSDVDKCRRDNKMLSSMVEQKNNDNLSLKTELQNLLKEKERLTVDRTIKELQTENDELRGEFTDKHILSGKRSKLFAVLSTSSSITVSWDKMSAQSTIKDRSDSFCIKFKESNTRWFTTIHVRALQDDTSIEIDNLKSNTKYLVKIFLCYEGEYIRLFEKECTTKKSMAHFLMKGAFIDEIQRPRLYHLQPVSTDIHPLQHVKNKEDEASVVDQIRICDMIAKRNPGQRQNEEKTVLLLGGTGTGKSTMIDALMNFIAGVSYNDGYRFILTNKTSDEEKRAKNQFESQTTSVTVYRIPKMEGLRVTCGVNIIDTPGFDSTRKISDKRITDQIKEVFDKRIDHLDAILIVVPLSTTRLTDAHQHALSNILKMFGEDIKQNIFVAVTWDDGGNLACVEALDKAHLPFAGILRFNNAKLYSAFSLDEGIESLNKLFWEGRKDSFKRLFKELESTQTTTVKSRKEVMKARHNLEIQLIALEDTISKVAQDIVNYKNDKADLDAIEKETPENQKKTIYRRIVPQMRRQFYGKLSFICHKCETTCHKNCKVLQDSLTLTCEAIKNSRCTVCEGRCDVVNHEVSQYIYDLHFRDSQFSGEQVVNRQKERNKFFGSLNKTLESLKHLIEEINTKAVEKDAFTIEQYIEDIANKEEKEKKQGYETRTQVQRKILEQIKEDWPIGNLTMNNFV